MSLQPVNGHAVLHSMLSSAGLPVARFFEKDFNQLNKNSRTDNQSRSSLIVSTT